MKLFLAMIPNYTLIRKKFPSTANVTISSALGTLDLLIPRFHADHWPANMDHASQRRCHGVTVLWGYFSSQLHLRQLSGPNIAISTLKLQPKKSQSQQELLKTGI